MTEKQFTVEDIEDKKIFLKNIKNLTQLLHGSVLLIK